MKLPGFLDIFRRLAEEICRSEAEKGKSKQDLICLAVGPLKLINLELMKPAGNVQSKAFLYFRFFYSRFIFSHLFCQDSLVAEAAKSATAAAREPAEDVAEAVEDHNGEEAKEEELPLEQDDVMDAT